MIQIKARHKYRFSTLAERRLLPMCNNAGFKTLIQQHTGIPKELLKQRSSLVQWAAQQIIAVQMQQVEGV